MMPVPTSVRAAITPTAQLRGGLSQAHHRLPRRNGKPFPEGSKIAKIEWRPKKVTDPPFSGSSPDTVPGDLAAVEVIEKDSKRFPDTARLGVCHSQV